MPYGCLPDCPQNTFKQFFGGFDVIMIGNSYQTPSMKDSWIFQNLKDNVNALAPIFWQTYAQCYELNKVMWQFDMIFIQIWNKFRIATKNTKDIQFVIDDHSTILLFCIDFMKINLCKNTMKMCSLTHLVPHLFSKQWTLDINHQSCPPFYKLSNDPNNFICLIL